MYIVCIFSVYTLEEKGYLRVMRESFGEEIPARTLTFSLFLCAKMIILNSKLYDKTRVKNYGLLVEIMR